MQRRHFLAAATAFGFGGAMARTGTFPERPVRIIIPYAAGGGPDVLARQIQNSVGAALGQPLVLENKVGAAGILGAQYVAQQPADGYNLLMGSNTHLIQKAMQPSLKFDPLAEFTPFSNMAKAPTVMVVRHDSPYRTLADVIADAQRRPGALNYGSGGIGTSGHLAGATFVTLAKVGAVHIPLKGSVEITTSLLRGDIDFSFPISAAGIPHIRAGKLRALCVTSARRLKGLPDVPTLHELMGNDLAIQESWFGFWAPAGTPEPILERLHAAVNGVLLDPQVAARFESSGNTAATTANWQAFAAFVRDENRKWAEIVQLSGIKST
jgi:tripartite-type tricarboxylate transporter receptor subunit TctC